MSAKLSSGTAEGGAGKFAIHAHNRGDHSLIDFGFFDNRCLHMQILNLKNILIILRTFFWVYKKGSKMQKSNLILVKLSLLVIFYFFNYEITKKVTFSVVYFFWKWSKQTLKNVKFTKKSNFEKPNFLSWPILDPEKLYFLTSSWWRLTNIQITFIDQFSKVSHFLFIRTHIKSNTNKMVLKFLRLADEISA